jgi:hypothetical protein
MQRVVTAGQMVAIDSSSMYLASGVNCHGPVFTRIYIQAQPPRTRHYIGVTAVIARQMKHLVMETIHLLLKQSGQSVPAKHLSIGDRSLQIYDVEHWPESFNCLLLHDFPSIVISIDSSGASLSGFVVTLHWKPAMDISEYIGVFVHCSFLLILSMIVLNSCWGNIQNVSTDSIEDMRMLYFGNNTTKGFGAHGPSSSLTDELRNVMSHGEL